MRAHNRRNGERGFALIAVLLGLGVIALILGAALHRSIAHVNITRFEARSLVDGVFYRGALEAGGLIALAGIAEGARRDPDAAQIVDVGDTKLSLIVRDVAGLIDVNTGDEALLRRLLSDAGPSGRALFDTIMEARREGRRIDAVDTVLTSLSGAETARTLEAAAYLTTMSGRNGIAASEAPIALLNALTGSGGRDRDALAAALPLSWRSTPTRRVFVVDILPEAEDRALRRGVIRVSTARGYRMEVMALPR